jgi:hypothetical protein
MNYYRVFEAKPDDQSDRVFVTLDNLELDDPGSDIIAIDYPIAHWQDQHWHAVPLGGHMYHVDGMEYFQMTLTPLARRS